MATPDHMARRAVLKGALAAPALALAGSPALASAETPVLRLYREREDLEQQIDSNTLPDKEEDRLYKILLNVERRMEKEPVTCLADLAAKVLVLTQMREETSTVYEPGLLAECEAIVAGRA